MALGLIGSLALALAAAGTATAQPSASVSAGGAHSCAIRTDGRLACWGDNSSGQVSGAPSGEFASVSAGGAHSCAIRSDHTLACWGDDSHGQVSGAPSGEFLAVSAGGAHSCAIRSDHTLVCWGDDSHGQVSGAPTYFDRHWHGDDEDEPDGDEDDPPQFSAVSAGGSHTCAIRTDRHLVCWGDDSHGQVSGAPSGEFLAVSAGGAHSCAIRSDHTLACWGDNSHGQVSGAPSGEFLAVSAGGAHSCAMAADGSVTCWGDNGAGQAQPELVRGEVPRAVVGTPYSHGFETTPQLPGPDFLVSAGELPPGLALGVGGQLEGEATEAGDFHFTVAADNGLTPGATEEVTLSVVGAPLPTVGSATAVTTSSARLNGTIDPRNLPAEAWFEYWPATEPANAAKTPAQAVPAGVAPTKVSAKVAGLSPDTEYVFQLAASNALGAEPVLSETAGLRTQQLPPAPVAAGLPAPIAGETVNVGPVAGAVSTKCEGEGEFAALGKAEQVPVGCLIDTRNGTVALTASKGSSGETETAEFWSGIFSVGQEAGDNQPAVLTLSGKLKCEKRGLRKSGRASASARRRGGRGLWGSGKGNYRTVGNYGSASVRGTTWFVKDRCDNSTVAKVSEGTVWFRDFVKGITVVLEPGEEYLAKAPIPRLKF